MRRSRFNPQPKTKRYRSNPHLIAVLQILQRYRYLPINFIYALLPKEFQTKAGYKYLQMRLTEYAGWKLVARPKEQEFTRNALYRKCVYTLGAEGKRLLEQEGLGTEYQIGKGNSFWHEVHTCILVASLELQFKDQFIHWPTILKQEKVPVATRESSSPFNIPVQTPHNKHAIPDGLPFCIRGNRALFFLGIETDMSTESLTGASKKTIEKKLLNYIDIAQRKTYQTHYGFPNMLIPFITTSEKRMNNMMEVLDSITHGKGASYILFSHVPHLKYQEESPDPFDLTTPFQRVNNPPFDLSTELNKAR